MSLGLRVDKGGGSWTNSFATAAAADTVDLFKQKSINLIFRIIKIQKNKIKYKKREWLEEENQFDWGYPKCGVSLYIYGPLILITINSFRLYDTNIYLSQPTQNSN
jgi:hypothetical protein